MNTKTAKYKKYLRLQKEQSNIEERYSFIIESSLGKRESRFNRYRGYSIGGNGAVDYTSVKETIKVPAHTVNHRWNKGNEIIPSIKYQYVSPTKDILKLDLFNNSLSSYQFINKTLLNSEVSEGYYYQLSEHLKSYFRVNKEHYSKRLETFDLIKGKVIEWFINEEGKSDYKYIDGLVREYHRETGIHYRYFFKYNIPIKHVTYCDVIERYHIFSDITKAYNEIDAEISRLCNHNYKLWYNNTRKSYRDNHRRKARRILKQNLIDCIKYDNFDLIRDKYYGPECDKWDYD